MSLIVTVVIASLFGSFFNSLCEASLYGVTPTQVELLRRKRVRGSECLAKLRQAVGSQSYSGYGRWRLKSRDRRRPKTNRVGSTYSKRLRQDVRELMRPTLFVPEPIVGEHDTDPEMQRMARERSRFRSLPPKTTSGQ